MKVETRIDRAIYSFPNRRLRRQATALASVSGFLRVCAEIFETRTDYHFIEPPKDWDRYIALTLPTRADGWRRDELIETRVMRFLLAAAVAESEGR